jgi:hypothetical protein
VAASSRAATDSRGRFPRGIGRQGGVESRILPKLLVATPLQEPFEPQRQAVAFEFNHPLRSKIDANWQITPQKISEFFTPDQQAMIREIFSGVHNPEYADKVMQHIQEDGSGIGNYSIALFGQPGPVRSNLSLRKALHDAL